MSSTNRGAVRNESDNYPTPEAAFKPLLPYLACCPMPAWEPSCGDGRLVRWLNAYNQPIRSDMEAWCLPVDDPRHQPPTNIQLFNSTRAASAGDDLNNGYDFLKDDRHHETIFTNPPFSLALEFCEHAVAHSANVFLLLRLNFLASKKRRSFFRTHEPSALFVLSERPSFTGNGKTDSIEYAWFGWTPFHKGIFHL